MQYSFTFVLHAINRYNCYLEQDAEMHDQRKKKTQCIFSNVFMVMILTVFENRSKHNAWLYCLTHVLLNCDLNYNQNELGTSLRIMFVMFVNVYTDFDQLQNWVI